MFINMNIQRWGVIEAHIKTQKMLDLVSPSNFNELKKIVTIIRQRYKILGGLKKVTTKLIFNVLYNVEAYDAVRHIFCVGNEDDRIFPTEIIRMQIQVCVRNPECIVSFKEVEFNGC